MASAPTKPFERNSAASAWRAPLVPAALAVTAGLVVDRYLGVPLAWSLAAAGLSVAVWMALASTKQWLALAYLALAAGCVGAAYHRAYLDVYPADDIGNVADLQPRLVRLRALVVEGPEVSAQPPQGPLQSTRRPEPTVGTLEATHLKRADEWVPVSGRVRFVVGDRLAGVHAGDLIETVGRLSRPPAAGNPGEFDYAEYLRDQRIRAELRVRRDAGAVTLLRPGTAVSPAAWLGAARGWSQRRLRDLLPAPQAAVADAILLGDTAAVSNADWEDYIKTGVIHVLVVSGQQLVILAGFLWLLCRLVGVRRRTAALGIVTLLLAYALLTGGRPPVMRAAVTVAVFGGALLLRRVPLLPNALALAWLTVLALNPTDAFSPGCQLSFLAVIVIAWGTSRVRRDPDALERLIEESRSPTVRALRWAGGRVATAYAVTIVIWLAAAPLVAARYHLVSPAGILIGPPTILLTSAALLSGFVALAASLVWETLAIPFAFLMRGAVVGCQAVVHATERLPGGHWYVGEVPEWWLWGFYSVLMSLLTVERVRRRWRGMALFGLAWLVVGLAGGAVRKTPDGLRCTFLAVGHGGCTVMETSDGRVLLFDAGALAGPDVARRQIAPFLWARGVKRVDEVFVSHADLDHFNGLVGLLERFPVGQVTCTPSFARKPLAAVALTLDELERRSVPVRVVSAGDRLSAGDATIDVLHPPTSGPDGNENARSMVLRVRHAGHSILLTGDLEGPGLERVLRLPAESVDVLQAPHHGSRTANVPALAAWASPRLAVSCQEPPRNPAAPPDVYTARGVPYWPTWPHGAVTVESRPNDLTAETFVTGLRLRLDPAGSR